MKYCFKLQKLDSHVFRLLHLNGESWINMGCFWDAKSAKNFAEKFVNNSNIEIEDEEIFYIIKKVAQSAREE